MAAQTIDYYEVLGVSRNATPEEIKQAFRKLAKIWHPDHHAGESEAEIKHAEYMFRLIHEAYDYLMNGGAQEESYTSYESTEESWSASSEESSYSRSGYYDTDSSYDHTESSKKPFFNEYELKQMFNEFWKVGWGILKWLLISASIILGLIIVAKAVMLIIHILLPLLIIGGIIALAYFGITYFLL